MFYVNHSKRGKSFIFDSEEEKIYQLFPSGEITEIPKDNRNEVLSHGKQIAENSQGFDDFDEAVEALKEERAADNARRKRIKEANKKLQEKAEANHAEAWRKLQDLEVIPATIENIRTVLFELNSTNWGIWELPKLTVSYSAAQYDCEGHQATTIVFDQPIEGHRKFKIGGKRGHLEEYKSL